MTMKRTAPTRSRATTRKKAWTHSTDIQTLIFDKEHFTEARAKAWAKRHKYRYGKVDEKTGTFRLRQHDPSDYRKSTLRTITLTEGVKAVSGVPLRAAATTHAKGYDTRGPQTRTANPRARPSTSKARARERSQELTPVLRLAREVVRTRKKGGSLARESALYPKLQAVIAEAQASGLPAKRIAAAVLREAPSRQASFFGARSNPSAIPVGKANPKKKGKKRAAKRRAPKTRRTKR